MYIYICMYDGGNITRSYSIRRWVPASKWVLKMRWLIQKNLEQPPNLLADDCKIANDEQ